MVYVNIGVLEVRSNSLCMHFLLFLFDIVCIYGIYIYVRCSTYVQVEFFETVFFCSDSIQFQIRFSFFWSDFVQDTSFSDIGNALIYFVGYYQ